MNKWKVITALIVMLIALVGGGVLSLGSDSRELDRHLELGQKYLTELDYE